MKRYLYIIISISLIMCCVALAGCRNDRLGENLGRVFKGLNPFDDKNYDSLPEKWQNEHVMDSAAAKEVMEALLESADKGDRDAFAANFTKELRTSPGFDDTLDKFLEAYPKGLGSVERESHGCSGSGSYNYGHNVLDASTYTEVTFDGEWYRIDLGFCYENTDEPDKVGVTYFTVMNTEARAVFLDEYNKDPDNKDDICLLCDIRSSSEVSARRINGIPRLWSDTPTPKLTEDEMRNLLMESRDLGIARKTIGEPNSVFKMHSANGYDFYYELKSDDGKPLYAHIVSLSDDGYIIDAYVCDEDKQYFDEPLAPYIKPEDR